MMKINIKIFSTKGVTDYNSNCMYISFSNRTVFQVPNCVLRRAPCIEVQIFWEGHIIWKTLMMSLSLDQLVTKNQILKTKFRGLLTSQPKLYIPSNLNTDYLLWRLAHTIDCVWSKILNHGLNHGLLFPLFKFFWWKQF